MPRRLRLAWVSSWSVRCGVAEYSRQLLGAVADDALDVRVLCDDRTGTLQTQDDPWPCWEVGTQAAPEALATAIAAGDPHMVMIQHQPGLISFGNLAWLLGHRVMRGRVAAVTLHNTSHLLDVSPAERDRAVLALRGVDRILVHTHVDIARLERLGLSANVCLLPHGVSPIRPAPPPRAFDVGVGAATRGTQAGPLIGCYGFFLPGKGIDVLIRALALVRQVQPGARLLLVNAQYDAPASRAEIERCTALVTELGLADAVSFETQFLPAYRSQQLLARCDVIALTYAASKEASSAALRSALTCGVPVAVTPIALFEEAGDAVFRFADGTPEAVAEGLLTLLADVPARAALLERAAAWTGTRLWPDVARRVVGMLVGMARTRMIAGDAPSGT